MACFSTGSCLASCSSTCLSSCSWGGSSRRSRSRRGSTCLLSSARKEYMLSAADRTLSEACARSWAASCSSCRPTASRQEGRGEAVIHCSSRRQQERLPAGVNLQHKPVNFNRWEFRPKKLLLIERGEMWRPESTGESLRSLSLAMEAAVVWRSQVQRGTREVARSRHWARRWQGLPGEIRRSHKLLQGLRSFKQARAPLQACVIWR